MLDIYFEPNYGKLYENHEKGRCETFEFNCSYGTVKTMFIKRQIPVTVNDQIYYDIVTPYGYGGPIITCLKKLASKDQLIKGFVNEFGRYCKKNNIISEFIRFHPVLNNASDFEKYYDIVHIRNTVGTNLEDYENPFQAEFSKSCRRNVRRALKNDVTFKIIEKPEDIRDFKDIYYSTMDRNKALNYYYFDENYFNKCVEYFKDNLLLVEAIYEERVIAMGLYFIYKDYIHTHLSGTLSEYLHLSPAYILRYAVTYWGKKNGYKLIHHGGGRTNDPEDSLYKYKKQFGKNTDFKFFIGRKIWNLEVYNELCRAKNVDPKTDYFPAYRFSRES